MTYSNDFKLQVLKCVDKGESTEDIIRFFGIRKQTLYNWINTRIQPKIIKKKDRKVKIIPEIQKYIVAYVSKKVNFDRKKLIGSVNKKYGISINKSSIYNILKKNNITKKYVDKKMVAPHQEKLDEQIKFFLEEIENFPYKNIISVDETSIDSHIGNNKGWSKKGTRITQLKKSPRVRYTAISAVGYSKVLYTKIILGSSNSYHFLSFIKKIITKLSSTQKYLIILDNCSIHKAAIVTEFINKQKNIKFVYNVPYSPQSNPIEFVFKDIKAFLKKHKITPTNIIKYTKDAFKNINGKNIKQYFNHSLNFYK